VIRRSLLPAAVERYVAEVCREGPLERRLRAETARLPEGGMQVGPDQAALLTLLARLVGARRALEIGTFTGMSALAVARALPPDGMLVACDVSEAWTAIARRYWAESGVAGRIELRLGPAAATLAALLREGQAGSFDFAFIDADKSGYDGYYEACLALVRPGGLVALDNMLWSGAVADREARDRDTRTLRALARKLRDDHRVEACLLTVGDGLMLARRRPG
jgi:predicted O-methyltransferase YrrM